MRIKYEKPCPVCEKPSEIFPMDYENKFLIKCSNCGKYYTVQTVEEKINIDEHPYFKRIEDKKRRIALSQWIKDNQNGDKPPKINRYTE